MITPHDPRNPHNAAPTGDDLARRAGGGLAVGAVLLVAAVIAFAATAWVLGLVLLAVAVVLMATGAVSYNRGKGPTP